MATRIIELPLSNCLALIEYKYQYPVRIHETAEGLELHDKENTVVGLDNILPYIIERYNEFCIQNAYVLQITFISSKYKKKAIKIHGIDWQKIHMEIMLIEPLVFDSTEQLIERCTISDY